MIHTKSELFIPKRKVLSTSKLPALHEKQALTTALSKCKLTQPQPQPQPKPQPNNQPQTHLHQGRHDSREAKEGWEADARLVLTCDLGRSDAAAGTPQRACLPGCLVSPRDPKEKDVVYANVFWASSFDDSALV